MTTRLIVITSTHQFAVFRRHAKVREACGKIKGGCAGRYPEAKNRKVGGQDLSLHSQGHQLTLRRIWERLSEEGWRDEISARKSEYESGIMEIKGVVMNRPLGEKGMHIPKFIISHDLRLVGSVGRTSGSTQ